MNDQKPKIIIVEDDPGTLKALERTLKAAYSVQCFNDPLQALPVIEQGGVAVVLSDQKMSSMSGLDFLARVGKVDPLVTRIIITSFTETEKMLDAINRVEIYRYITKPWENEELLSVFRQSVERYQLRYQNRNLLKKLQDMNARLESEVAQRTSELKTANKLLEEQACHDPLTNLFNRRAFETRLRDEIERSSRYQHPISVAMIDVDHFKHLNDMEGHVHGDEALKKVAQIINRKIRRTDCVARYGGEEFVLMMPETSLEKARDICERLRNSIERAIFQGKKGEAFLTISIGVAAFPNHAEDLRELIDHADQALYEAKENGRNRVVVC